jgi:hypothetical protein
MNELTMLAISPPPMIENRSGSSDSGVIWIKFPSGGRSFPPLIQDVVEESVNAIHDIWAGFTITEDIQQFKNTDTGLIVQFSPNVVADITTVSPKDYTYNIDYNPPHDSAVFATYYQHTTQNGAINMKIPPNNYLLPSETSAPQKRYHRNQMPQPDLVVHHYHHIVE